MGDFRDGSVEPTRIMVGVDASPSSVEALRWAARLAHGLGGHVAAVMAWQYPANAVMGSFPTPERDLQHDAEDLLAKAVQRAYGDTLPDGLSQEVIQGPAAHVLIDRSRDARLLIVGSRGLGGFKGMLLGSVSASCAEHAACPVLVLH